MQHTFSFSCIFYVFSRITSKKSWVRLPDGRMRLHTHTDTGCDTKQESGSTDICSSCKEFEVLSRYEHLRASISSLCLGFSSPLVLLEFQYEAVWERERERENERQRDRPSYIQATLHQKNRQQCWGRAFQLFSVCGSPYFVLFWSLLVWMIAGSIRTNRTESSDWYLSLCCANLFSLQRQKCSCLMCTCAFKGRREPRQGSFLSLASSWILFALKHCMTGKGEWYRDHGMLGRPGAESEEAYDLCPLPSYLKASIVSTCLHVRLLGCLPPAHVYVHDWPTMSAGTYTPARMSPWRPVQFSVSSMIHPRQMLGTGRKSKDLLTSRLLRAQALHQACSPDFCMIAEAVRSQDVQTASRTKNVVQQLPATFAGARPGSCQNFRISQASPRSQTFVSIRNCFGWRLGQKDARAIYASVQSSALTDHWHHGTMIGLWVWCLMDACFLSWLDSFIWWLDTGGQSVCTWKSSVHNCDSWQSQTPQQAQRLWHVNGDTSSLYYIMTVEVP